MNATRPENARISRGMAALVLFAALSLGLQACSTAQPVQIPLDSFPQSAARLDLIQPLLVNLRDFGNNMAALMLTDYRYKEMSDTGSGAYLYRFDRSGRADLPAYAYIVFRLEGSPSMTTNNGEKNYILLDGGSIGLVPADKPAVVTSGSFVLQFTQSSFREAFNPWVIGAKGSYPEQILLWFKNPVTKDEDMRRMASLLKSAFPRLTYR